MALFVKERICYIPAEASAPTYGEALRTAVLACPFREPNAIESTAGSGVKFARCKHPQALEQNFLYQVCPPVQDIKKSRTPSVNE